MAGGNRAWKGPPHLKPLDAREERFLHAYLACLNPKQAALEAGYSESIANSKAYLWVRGGKDNQFKPHLAFEIEKELAKTTGKLQLTAELIRTQMARLISFDIRKLYNEDGSLKKPHEWDDDTAAAVSGMEVSSVTEGKGDDAEVVTIRKVKTEGKVPAAALGAKILGMLTEKVEAKVAVEAPTLNIVVKRKDG